MKNITILSSVIGFIFVLIGIVYAFKGAGAVTHDYIIWQYSIATLWSIFGLFFLNISFISYLFDRYLINKKE
jgi:hypothetical protein